MSLPILVITVVAASWLVALGILVFALYRLGKNLNRTPRMPDNRTTTRRSMDR